MKNPVSKKLGSSLNKVLALALVFLLAVGVVSLGFADVSSVDAANVGSNTFVYVGTSGKSAGDLWWYVTWAKSNSYTTATKGQLSTFNITKTTSTINGYSAVTLSGDTSDLSDIWANFGFDGQISYTQIPLDGTTYFISDSGISTIPPADYTTTTTTAAANIGSNTFVYVGTSGKSANDLWWYVTWAKSNSYTTATEGQLSTFKMTKTVGTYGDYTAVTISGDKNDLSDIWANFGFDGKISNTKIPLDGKVYYISDSGISTTAPTTTTTESTTTATSTTSTTTTTTTTVANNEYSLTVNLYAESGAMGAWPMTVENGTETAWGDTKTASVGSYDGEWSKAVLSWSTPNDYNSIGFQVSTTSDPWAGSKYSTSFANNSAVVWIIPGDSTVYTSLEDAKKAIEDAAPKNEYNLNVYLYAENGALGAWTILVENGAETAWGDTKTTTFGSYDGEWSFANISWTTTDTYNRVGFQASDTSDPWAGAKYSIDFSEDSATVWVVPGASELYTSLEDAKAAIEGGVESDLVDYSLTIHYRDDEGVVGAWMALVENGSEVAWTDSTESRDAVFADYDGTWSTAVLEWSLADTYNRFGFQIDDSELWTGIKRNFDFTENSAEVWVVPGYYIVFDSAEEANRTYYYGLTLPPVTYTEYTATIHYRAESGVVGGWLARVENGEEVAWTDSGISVTAEFTDYDGEWSTAVLKWRLADSYNRVGFQLDASELWVGTKYAADFNENNCEVWIIPEDDTVYDSLEAAKASLEPEEEPEEEPVEEIPVVVEPEKESGFNWWYLLIGAAVAAGIAVLIIVLVKKNKKDENK